MIERQLNLLKLLSKQNNYKPASFFSDKLSVSTKTIYQDIDVLKVYSKQFNVEINSLPSVGIKIKGNINKINLLLSKLKICIKSDMYSPENRRTEIIKQIFFSENKPGLESLSNYFMVSKTSLYNDIKVINKIINIENVQVISSTEGIAVIGDETSIQQAIKQVVFYSANNSRTLSFLQILESLFDSTVVNEVYKLLLNEYSELTENVSDYYIRSLLTTFVIQCNRLLNGHHVQQKEDFLFNKIRYMETYIVANTLVEELKNLLNLEFREQDKEYLSRQLFAHRITDIKKVSNENYSNTVQKLIIRMSDIEKLDFTNDKHLYKSLLYHIPAMVLRLEKGIRIHNPLLKSIKTQYSELFSIVWYALVVIEKQYNVVLNDEEVSLILIHFQTAIEKQLKVNNIVIVCEYGMSSAQLIYNKVRRFLPARDNVEISTVDKLNFINAKSIDLVISSIDLDIGAIPYVKVSPLVNNNDYVGIMESYTKYIIAKPHFIGSDVIPKVRNTKIISEFIDPSFIKLEIDVESKEECLDLMISELEKRNYVTDEFRKSVFNREKMGNTNLESGVALPHGNPSTVSFSSISLLTLKKPVDWGDRKVKMVAMISFSEENTNEIKDVVKELYQIIETKESVDAVVKIKDVKDMMEIFKVERI